MRVLLLTTCLAALAVTARAEPLAPVPLRPDSFGWASPPALPGLRTAWVLGAEATPGPYVLRVRLAPGTRIAPHTHPDDRICTVLAGTVSVAFGAHAEPAQAVAMTPGTVYVLPANVPHTVWAGPDGAEYQESGTAPTGTTFLPAPAR
jgi:quercetin dioxygenase-like cupin family protein